MSVRLIRMGLGEKGATVNAGLHLTDAEIEAKTVIGPDQFADWGITSMNSICHDYSGNLYFTDVQRHVVCKVTESGIFSIIGGSVGTNGDNGTLTSVAASASRFNAPKGICCDKYGTVYVADTNNHQIRTIKGGRVGLLAGGGTSGGFVDGNGLTALFSGPRDVAVDKAGRVFVADWGNHSVRKIDNDGKVVNIAGNGSDGDGLAENSTRHYARRGAAATDTSITDTETSWPSRRNMFNRPSHIAVDTQGIVYVWDSENHKMKKITRDGQVLLHSGSGTQGASLGTDETPSYYPYTCQYTDIMGIDPDESGNLYVADKGTDGSSLTNKSRILKFDYNGKPSVVADFPIGSTYVNGPWCVCVTPGQKMFAGFTY